MSDEECVLEENVKNLMQAGFDYQVRPSPEQHQRVLQKLLTVQAENREPNFPAPVIIGIIGLLMALAGWLVVKWSVSDMPPFPIIYLGVLIIMVNLAWIPVASLTIIFTRRFYAK